MGIALALAMTAAAAPVGQYGVCSHVTRSGFPFEKTLDKCAEGGIGWVRCDLDWSHLEKKPGEWSFAKFDAILDAAEARGVRILPILGYEVRHAKPVTEHLDDWTNYVATVVRRYGRRLPMLEVWNEEDGLGWRKGFWKHGPEEYAKLLRATHETVKSIDPGLKVGIGGLVGCGGGSVEKLYDLGASDCFDFVCVHPYTWPHPPEDCTDKGLAWLKKVLADHGDAEKPVWITEVGWPTHDMKIPAPLLDRALAVARPGRKAWRTVYAGHETELTDQAFLAAALERTLPPGSTCEYAPPERLAARLAAGGVDAVFYPFGEQFASATADAVYEFVKAGGVLVDYGGMPMWTGVRRTSPEGFANDPKPQDAGAALRKRLRIGIGAWWMDKAKYPKEIPLSPTPIAGDVKPPKKGKGWIGTRFLHGGRLEAGDEFIPLLAGVATNGAELASLAVFRYGSDLKGAAIVSTLMLNLPHPSSEERQARMLLRALAIAFSTGVDAFFPYELRSDERDRTNPEAFFGLTHSKLESKPAFDAYAKFMRMRPSGSVPAGDLPLTAGDGVYASQWRTPEGRIAGMVWTRRFTTPRRLVFDGTPRFETWRGEPLSPPRGEDGAYSLDLSQDPVFFAGATLTQIR